MASVHTASMLVVTTLVAICVYEFLGLRILRTAWVNLDRVWAVALVGAGTATAVAPWCERESGCDLTRLGGIHGVMPKINVYLPDDLAESVKETGLPVSAICQRALEQSVKRVSAIRAAVIGDLNDDDPTAGLTSFTQRAKDVIKLGITGGPGARCRGDRHARPAARHAQRGHQPGAARAAFDRRRPGARAARTGARRVDRRARPRRNG